MKNYAVFSIAIDVLVVVRLLTRPPLGEVPQTAVGPSPDVLLLLIGASNPHFSDILILLEWPINIENKN